MLQLDFCHGELTFFVYMLLSTWGELIGVKIDTYLGATGSVTELELKTVGASIIIILLPGFSRLGPTVSFPWVL